MPKCMGRGTLDANRCLVDTSVALHDTSAMMIQRPSPTHMTLQQLSKVLDLEARKDYQDSAVVGGLERFVTQRVGQLRAAASGDAVRQIEALNALVHHYASMPVDQRQRSVAEARQLVAMLLSGPASALVLSAPMPAGGTPSPAANEKEKRRRAAQPPVTRTSSSRATAPVRVDSLSDGVQRLPGVGATRVKQLEQLGVMTIWDLLRTFPRRYADYSNVQQIASVLFGHVSTIRGTVVSIERVPTRTGKQFLDVVIDDGTGRIHATWFNPYIERQLPPGTEVSLSGRIERMRGSLVMSNPEWEVLEGEALHTGRIIPVYPLVKGLYQKQMRALMRVALDAAQGLHQDPLPESLRIQEGLIGLAEALEWIHFPEGETPQEAERRLAAARHRLAFDDFLVLQIGLLQRKQQWKAQPGEALDIDLEALRRFGEALPYQLTRAQRRALSEIMRDLAAPQPMTRLLQGDVGSGKTVVAAAAAAIVIRAGYQAALMAPTEILAEQHERSLRQVFAALPEDIRPRIGFLTGSVGGAERAAVYAGLEDGTLDLVIGTQALIQSSVAFHRLGLAIVDEQHRFGVEQRALIRAKGDGVNLLVMTATPIPRTLALTLHGDLDVSTLDELPPGRQAIETRWLSEAERGDAYAFIREQVQLGRQAFIVFPLVEESEAVDARAAVDEHERLSRDVFPDLRLGLLHGRMKPAEKDAVMLAFRDQEIDILVSTSVVEVGIDVPNATVMVIDGADRFGLSQLHQFRGRVGRGSERSYCLLISSSDISQDGRTRLRTMVDSQDGFYLAQIDLELRGPGDFIGTRQSGLPELQLATFADVRVLERARMAAERILAQDPQLASGEYALLDARMRAFWTTTVADVS
jgi:ATP-dependent DNA helicase RecG